MVQNQEYAKRFWASTTLSFHVSPDNVFSNRAPKKVVVARSPSTRKSNFLLAVVLALAIGFGAANSAAQKPWKEKTLGQWSQEELLKLLNDSPWTKEDDILHLTRRRRRVFRSERFQIVLLRLPATYAVRWSSATIIQRGLERLREITPVLAIMQAPPPELSPQHYVLTVRAVKPPHRTPDIFSGLSEEELLQAAELRIDRGRRLKPGKVQRHGLGAGEGISFFFPRQVDGQPTLPPGTKQVEFRFEGRMGSKLKARFKLNEMTINDQPDY